MLGKRKFFSNNSNEEDECQKMSPLLLLENEESMRKIPVNKNLKGNTHLLNTFGKCSPNSIYERSDFSSFFLSFSYSKWF